MGVPPVVEAGTYGVHIGRGDLPILRQSRVWNMEPIFPDFNKSLPPALMRSSSCAGSRDVERYPVNEFPATIADASHTVLESHVPCSGLSRASRMRNMSLVSGQAGWAMKITPLCSGNTG